MIGNNVLIPKVNTFPININLVSVSVVTDTEHKGDMYEVQLAPNTIIGTITQDVATGATAINASQTVIDNLKIEFSFSTVVILEFGKNLR